ncbi:MAG: carbohydrate-binding domain-containing protein, partial [Oscillospiraceae bacterium]|nr:carbohydrate-binding domain-containing protein [Oscillospiraceae bacterium]
MKSIFQASRRAICWLLSLALILSFLPAGLQKASAAESEDAIVFTFSDSGITVTDGAGNEIADYSAYAKVKGTALTINAPGSYVVTGSCADGSVSVKKSVENVTLTLRDLTLHSNLSAPFVVKKYAQVDILIEGTVTLTDTVYNSEDYLVDKGYATYDSTTDVYTYTGTLEGTTAGDEAAAENAVMKLKGATKVTLGGTGTLNITALAKNGIKSGATLVSTTDDTETAADPTNECFAYLEISDLTVNIDATGVYDPDGTGSGSGGWGQQSNETYGDCINAESSLRLISGTYNIAAGDDGIKSDYYLTIGKIDGADSALDINVTQAVEGLEGAILNIYSGDMDLVTSDDAINAANSDLTNFQYQLNIYGGDLYANGSGDDGLDSNGWLKIYGGKVIVFSGSDQTASCFDTGTDGNSAIDDTFQIFGGNVLGLGQGGMAIKPESGSQDWVSWGSSSHGGPGWGGGGSSGSSSNMSDYSNIKLKVGNSSYSVGSSVS